MVRLWTIQHIDVLNKVNIDGHYIMDGSIPIYSDEFKVQYDWITKKMKDCEIGKEFNYTSPIWTYSKIKGVAGKKPDFRMNRFKVFNEAEDELVLLELEVPKSEVMNIGHYPWELVLFYGQYMPGKDEFCEFFGDWSNEYNKKVEENPMIFHENFYFHNSSNDKIHKEDLLKLNKQYNGSMNWKAFLLSNNERIVKSWDHLIDNTMHEDYIDEEYVQGLIGCIKEEYIKNVIYQKKEG